MHRLTLRRLRAYGDSGVVGRAGAGNGIKLLADDGDFGP
jgi:hypothetical protein